MNENNKKLYKKQPGLKLAEMMMNKEKIQSFMDDFFTFQK